MILAHTTAQCNRCSQSHPADLVRVKDGVEAVVHCPEGDIRHEISSDAELFMRFRRLSPTDYTNPTVPCGMRHVLNYISITNACNLNCTVCGAAAKVGSTEAVFLPVGEICRRAEEARKAGGKILHLFGGEPSIHPELLTIVEKLSRMGFSTGMVTNGVRLGTEPGLAKELKARGLSRICLQFDSLDQATLQKLGRDYLEQKQAAIRHAMAAGLSVGLNCTVTKQNLDEVGTLLLHGLDLGIPVRNMTFASAAPVGRYKLPPQDTTDREQIIHRLLAAGARHGLTLDDILPLPAYLPWGIQNHPDCGAHIVFVRTPAGIRPLNHFIDLLAVYRCMARNRMQASFFASRVLPGFYVLRAIRKGQWLACLRTAWGLLTAKKRYALVNVGTSNYKGAAFLDNQRIHRCCSAFHTSVGAVKGCLHFCGNPAAPGSKNYEECHGSC